MEIKSAPSSLLLHGRFQRNADMTEDDTLERVAIAGATAIQHIIAERNDLRNCTHVQQQELVALRAVNEQLRGRITLVHRQYVEFATGIIAHLEKFDRATRDAMLDKHDPATLPSDAGKSLQTYFKT